MKKRILQYVSDWQKRCYFEGLPDEAPTRLEQLNKVPSYRLIVKAVLKNDVVLETLGYNKRKCNAYHTLKRIELESRNPSSQLKLF